MKKKRMTKSQKGFYRATLSAIKAGATIDKDTMDKWFDLQMNYTY
jgi:hypothetical protein